MNRWQVHFQIDAWRPHTALHVLRGGIPPGEPRRYEHKGDGSYGEPDEVFRALPMRFEKIDHGAAVPESEALLSGNHHFMGTDDVRDFLQAMLDTAWKIGIRPREYADHKDELSAIGRHLEDMRRLVGLGDKPVVRK